MNARVDVPAGRPILGLPLRSVATMMTLLSGLFLLRVIGQVLVTYAGVSWLPEKGQWESGLLPYPSLLASQIAILAVMAAVAIPKFGSVLGPSKETVARNLAETLNGAVHRFNQTNYELLFLKY